MSSYEAQVLTQLLVGLLGIVIAMFIFLAIFMIYNVIICWRVYKKAGKHGWTALIPFVNWWTLFSLVYGSGVKSLLMFIPIVNVIIICKVYFDLAYCFGQDTLFGLGLLFLTPIFFSILAFGKNYQYVGIYVGNGQVQPVNTTYNNSNNYNSYNNYNNGYNPNQNGGYNPNQYNGYNPNQNNGYNSNQYYNGMNYNNYYDGRKSYDPEID